MSFLLSPSATPRRGQGPCHTLSFLSCTKTKCRRAPFLRPISSNPDTRTLRTGTVPFARSLPSRHREGAQHCTWGRSSGTAAACASIPGHTGKGARAEPPGQSQAGGQPQLQLKPERPWQKGDDTELGYGTTFILSYLRPTVVNKHVTTDEGTRSHAGCFRPCITP